MTDQLLVLLTGVCFGCLGPYMCNYAFVPIIIYEILLILIWGFFCKRTLLLLIDLIQEKEEKVVYFSKMSNFDEYDFFGNIIVNGSFILRKEL